MNTVIHKCPDCKVSLVPITRVGNGITWVSHKISAEKAMYLKDYSYKRWECPKCGMPFLSEIEDRFCNAKNYKELKISIRVKRR